MLHRHFQLLRLSSLLCALVVTVSFANLMYEILSNGIAGISVNWFIQNPENAGRAGGIASILISTTLITIVCLACSAPIALSSAIFLSELLKKDSHVKKMIYNALDLLASVPSIVFGLFGFSFFVIKLNMGFSILAGGLTLAIMVLPLLIRLFRDNFENIPKEYRLNGLASGLGLWSLYTKVMLPIARKGIVTAIVLSLARAVSETAALIFTAGYVYRMPESLLDSGRSLSVHILDLAMNVPGGDQNSYTSALTLLIFLLVINLTVIMIARSRPEENSIRL